MSQTDGRETFIPRCYKCPAQGEKQMLWYVCTSMYTVCQHTSVPSKIESRGRMKNAVPLASTDKIYWQDQSASISASEESLHTHVTQRIFNENMLVEVLFLVC